MMTDPSCSPQSLWEKGIQVIFNLNFSIKLSKICFLKLCSMYNITFVFFTWVLAWRKTLKTCTYRQTHLPQQVTGAYRSGELVKQQLNRVHSHFQEQYFHSTMCLAGISLSESLVDKNSQLVVMTFTGVLNSCLSLGGFSQLHIYYAIYIIMNLLIQRMI